MTPAEKRKNTIYMRSIDRLVREIMVDELERDTISLPKRIVEIMVNTKVSKGDPVLLYGKKVIII